MKHFIFCLGILYSCSQKVGVIKSPAFCDEFKNEIKQNWKLGLDSTFYETNFHFLRRVDSTFKQCLINESNVISLFGRPNKRGNSFHRLELIYHIDKPCTPEHKYSCTDFIIYFDKVDTVSGTMILTTNPTYIQKME